MTLAAYAQAAQQNVTIFSWTRPDTKLPTYGSPISLSTGMSLPRTTMGYTASSPLTKTMAGSVHLILRLGGLVAEEHQDRLELREQHDERRAEIHEVRLSPIHYSAKMRSQAKKARAHAMPARATQKREYLEGRSLSAEKIGDSFPLQNEVRARSYPEHQ